METINICPVVKSIVSPVDDPTVNPVNVMVLAVPVLVINNNIVPSFAGAVMVNAPLFVIY